MTRLIDLQRGLRDHILAGRPSPAAGVAASGEPGLSVYRHAYRAQLVETLRDTYEKTWSWLGDAGFEAAALTYVEAHAPSAWTLADYGGGFVGFLAARWPDDPEVAELAWLDWTLRRAFDGSDGEPISPDVLAEADWDTATLTFVPTLTVGSARTNAAAIWTALAEDELPPPAERLPAPAAIRVWRTGFSPQYRAIEGAEARALDALRGGLGFSAFCVRLGEDMDDPEAAAAQAGALLAAWLHDGLIQAIG